jgi:hypothetical protein
MSGPALAGAWGRFHCHRWSWLGLDFNCLFNGEGRREATETKGCAESFALVLALLGLYERNRVEYRRKMCDTLKSFQLDAGSSNNLPIQQLDTIYLY